MLTAFTIMNAKILRRLQEEFDAKYKRINEYMYSDHGIGIEDVKEYPDTKLHRELYPHLYYFTFYGFQCHIKRNNSACWCGYVKIYPSHPFWENGDSFDDYPNLNHPYVKDIKVHGGITYSYNDEIGFDCSHGYDALPFDTTQRVGEVYRTREYVVNQLKKLCLQMYLLLPKWSPQTHHHFLKDLQERFWSIYKLWYLRKSSDNLSKILEKNIWIRIIQLTFELEKRELSFHVKN